MKNKSIVMAFKISVLKKKLFEHIVIEQNYYFSLKLERCNENNILFVVLMCVNKYGIFCKNNLISLLKKKFTIFQNSIVYSKKLPSF